jgi:diguanylate cyclase (GGDEF)-like protein/PAS domain S-box-containing protein
MPTRSTVPHAKRGSRNGPTPVGSWHHAETTALVDAAMAPAMQSLDAQPLRILLVVDDPHRRKRVLTALRNGGFDPRFEFVDTPAKLRAALLARPWDLVLSDFALPSWDGLAVLREVRAAPATLPVILICGAIGEAAASDAVRRGASDCIQHARIAARLAQSVRARLSEGDNQARQPAPLDHAALLAQHGLQSMSEFPVAVYVCDMDGKICSYNHAAARIWGCQPRIGTPIWQAGWKTFTPDGRPIGAHEWQAAIDLRKAVTVIHAYITIERPDGSVRHIAPNPQFLRDGDGHPCGVVDMWLDLTDRKHQERRLLQSDATARSMFDNSPVASMMRLPFSTITAVNNKFIALTGYSRAEVLGRTAEELDILVDDHLSQRMVGQLRTHGSVSSVEINYRRKDGSVGRALASSATVFIGGIAQTLSSFSDITAQVHALEQTRLAQQALKSISQGVLISGPDWRAISVNKAFETMTGYSEQELVGRSCALLQGADTDPRTVDEMRRALDAGQSCQAEIRNYRKDGTPFWNALSIDPVHDADGHLSHFVGIQRDITQSRDQHLQLQLANQIVDQAREGVLVTDANARLVMVNKAFSRITGYEADEVLGHNPRILSSGRHDPHFYQAMWHQVQTHGFWVGDIWNRRKDGQEYLESLSLTVLRDARGQISHYVGTMLDVTVERTTQARLDWLAHFDALTGLANRDLLRERCSHDISVARREGKPVAMLVVGLDRFSTINDAMGFAVGDKMLEEVARRMTHAVREHDTVARHSGDEFVLVLPGETLDGACGLADRLQQVLAFPLQVDGSEVTASASIGIAMFPEDGQDFTGLVGSAQVAMHKSKERGGNQRQFYRADMSESTIAKVAVVTALRNAIRLDQLALHYQPFADMQTGRIGGMEALLRWTHPELGRVSPATFIPIAEQSGQIIEIGYWVLRRACQDLQQWRDKGLPVPPVSVNLSPKQIRDPELLANIVSIMKEFAVEPGLICLELTEGAMMDDVAHSERLMHALKGIGVRLALDDFGTGYSSLSHLKRFPFDKVKIDQSFVRGIHTNPQDAVIAKIVISMAHGLGLRVVAEGVETEMQCEFMQRNACDEIQGYFFARPVPAIDLEAILREDRRLPAHLVRMQTHTRTLLLVDDEPDEIAALQQLLQGDGYRILTATSGAEGLALMASHAIDVVVSDQDMPGMTGLEFLHQASVLHPESMRIVLSRKAELRAIMVDALNANAIHRFMTRPWDDRQLRALVKQAFHLKELNNENTLLGIKVRAANQELAVSNRKLQEALNQKQRALTQGQHRLDVLREALQHVPLPVLAIDREGVVEFANVLAEGLYAGAGPLPGNALALLMPSVATLLVELAQAEAGSALIAGQPYLVRWHAMGDASDSSSRIVTLTPAMTGTTP